MDIKPAMDMKPGTRLSLQRLEPQLAKRIRALHVTQPRWNWVCLLYPFGWLTTALLLEHLPAGPWVWPSRLAGLMVIAVCIQAIGIVMHEALHGNLFRRASADRWATTLCGLPAFFSGTAYRVAHLHHHRHTRGADDQDEIANLCRTPGQYRILFYAWFFAGMLIYLFMVPVKALSLATPSERRRIWAEQVAMLVLYVGVIGLAVLAGRADALLLYWLLPAQIAILLSNVRSIAEHACTSKGAALTSTRTIRSNACVSFLMLNLNYHLEHHLFPGVPWYHLPRLNVELAPLYAGEDPFIEGSYLRYAFRALRRGPCGEIRCRD